MPLNVQVEVKFIFRALKEKTPKVEHSIIDLLVRSILYSDEFLNRQLNNSEYEIDLHSLYHKLKFIDIETNVPLKKPNLEDISEKLTFVRHDAGNSLYCLCRIDDIYVIVAAIMSYLPTIATQVLANENEFMISPRLIFPDINLLSVYCEVSNDETQVLHEEFLSYQFIADKKFLKIAIDQIFPSLGISRKSIHSLIDKIHTKFGISTYFGYDQLNSILGLSTPEGYNYQRVKEDVYRELQISNFMVDFDKYFTEYLLNEEIQNTLIETYKSMDEYRSTYFNIEKGHIVLGLHPRLEIVNIHALFPKDNVETIKKFMLLRIISSDIFFRFLGFNQTYNELLAGVRTIRTIYQMFDESRFDESIEEADLVDYFYDFMFFNSLYNYRKFLFHLISKFRELDISEIEEKVIKGQIHQFTADEYFRERYPTSLSHRLMGIYHVIEKDVHKVMPIEQIIDLVLSGNDIREGHVYDRDSYFNYYLDKQDLNLLPDFSYDNETIPIDFPLYFKPFEIERYFQMELKNPKYTLLQSTELDPFRFKNLVLSIRPKNPNISSKAYVIFYYFMRRLFEDHNQQIENVMTPTGSDADYFLDKITSKIGLSEIRMYANKTQLNTTAPDELLGDGPQWSIPSSLNIQIQDVPGVYLFFKLIQYLNETYRFFTKNIVTKINSSNFEHTGTEISTKPIEELFNVVKFVFSANFNIIGLDRLSSTKQKLPVNLTISRTKVFLNFNEEFFGSTRISTKYLEYHLFVLHREMIIKSLEEYRERLVRVIQEEEEQEAVGAYFDVILEMIDDKEEYSRKIYKKLQEFDE